MRIFVQSPKWQRMLMMFLSVMLCVSVYDVAANLTTTAALPTLAQLANAVIQVCKPQGYNHEIWLLEDCMATFGRLLLALVTSSILGVFLGVLMGCYDKIDAFLTPPLSFASYTPSTAIVAVLAVFFDTSERLFLVLLCIAMAPALALKISTAIKNEISQDMVDKTYTLGAWHDENIWNYVMRQIWPHVMDNIRLQIGPAVVAVICAELMVGSVGFGYRIRYKSRRLDWDVVYVYLVILSASGFLFENVLTRIRQWTCRRWTERR